MRLDLVRRRDRLTTHQATGVVGAGQRHADHLPEGVVVKGGGSRATKGGKGNFLTVHQGKSEANKVGACLTKILVQGIRRGCFRIAGEIAEEPAILTSERAEIRGPIGPPEDSMCRHVPRKACIAGYEALQAYGLGKGERAAEGCSEVDHIVAGWLACSLLG